MRTLFLSSHVPVVRCSARATVPRAMFLRPCPSAPKTGEAVDATERIKRVERFRKQASVPRSIPLGAHRLGSEFVPLPFELPRSPSIKTAEVVEGFDKCIVARIRCLRECLKLRIYERLCYAAMSSNASATLREPIPLKATKKTAQVCRVLWHPEDVEQPQLL